LLSGRQLCDCRRPKIPGATALPVRGTYWPVMPVIAALGPVLHSAPVRRCCARRPGAECAPEHAGRALYLAHARTSGPKGDLGRAATSEALRRPSRRVHLRVESLAARQHLDEPLDATAPRPAALGGLYSVEHGIAVSATEIVEGLLGGRVCR